MNVLFVINCFAMAGAEKLVFDLAKALGAEGCHITVAGLYDRGDSAEAAMMDALSASGVHCVLLHKGAGRDRIRSILALRSIIRQEQIDIIHAHCSVPMLLAKFAGLGKPVVCTVHSTKGYSRLRESLTGWLASRYISIGQAVEDYMTRSLRIPTRKISRIYNGVDTDIFRQKPRIPGFWKQWGLEEAYPVVLQVGRFTPGKNQLCLLKALKLCRDRGVPIQAVFLGDHLAEGSTYPALAQYVQQHDLGKLVRFLGVQQNVADFLNQADCFVMTSTYEGFSIAFLEAVLCGTAVVSSELPFVEELSRLAGQPCCLVFPQNDPVMLANALQNFPYAPQSPQAVSRISCHFSLKSAAMAHFKLYESLIHRS